MSGTDKHFYHAEMVRSFLERPADNAFLVYFVDDSPAGSLGSVHDGFVVEEEPYVYDLTFVIVEKGEIAALRVLQKIYEQAFGGLLAGISGQGQVAEPEGHLGEP